MQESYITACLAASKRLYVHVCVCINQFYINNVGYLLNQSLHGSLVSYVTTCRWLYKGDNDRSTLVLLRAGQG